MAATIREHCGNHGVLPERVPHPPDRDRGDAARGVGDPPPAFGRTTAARDRQADARARVEALQEAGLLPDLAVEEWPSKAVVPSDGPAVETYDEFVGTTGTRPAVHLDPFFEDRPGVGRAERVVVLPVVCVAVRREGELTELYPCWNEGTHYAVEDGLAALEAGETVENLR